MPVIDAPLIDTGPIVASLDANDAYHRMCETVFDHFAFAYTSWPVITEAVYLLGNHSLAVEKLFVMLRSGRWRLLSLDRSDLDGIEQILAKYRDQGFQLADASLMHLANREGIDKVLTLDRTDFELYRTPLGKRLTILPDEGYG